MLRAEERRKRVGRRSEIEAEGGRLNRSLDVYRRF